MSLSNFRLKTTKILPVCLTLINNFATAPKDFRPLYLLPGTDPTVIPFISKFQVVFDIRDFCIPSLKSGGKKRRPEFHKHISIYTPQEANRINSNHRTYIQKLISKKAQELLDSLETTHPKMILDIGCGTGLSMEPLIKNGHWLIGIDLTIPMLSVAKTKRLPSCDFISADCCLPFLIRESFFDAAISVSFLQWLTTSGDGRSKTLETFFLSVSRSLKQEGCFVAQFYPKDPEDALHAVNVASRFFVGALLACRPTPERGLKLFLVLRKRI